MSNRLDRAIRRLEKAVASQEKLIAAAEAGAKPQSVVDLKRRQDIQRILNNSLCTAVQLGPEAGDGRITIHTPFYFADGDPYMIYLKELPTGDWRLTDGGHTFMHLSYENTGHLKHLDKILHNTCIQEKDGELFVDFPSTILGSLILRFGQAIAMVCVLVEAD